jgi:hypothetical protein
VSRLDRRDLARAVLLVAAAALLGWRLLTLYGSGSPRESERHDAPYTAALQAALARGLAHDSAGVAALAAAPQPAAWISAAVRRDSLLVRAWTARLVSSWGTERGDTTVLRWYPLAEVPDSTGDRCHGGAVLDAKFVGDSSAPRLARLSSPCVADTFVAPITFAIDSASRPAPPR